ncbi:uncharacterized protein LOC113747891 isoform X2 [Larimichthys crocea]|uniref:uncharacterized protein LOC113747891 isoform X2 n=1 Tax=Larimichthys crocea TaxID=215358 RepID=UPI000F5F0C24|nr:uncharacterized protein LOC113747891 isoform X2 [Larimichthys crocea]
MWIVEKVLKALHYLFQCAPARREDFSSATECSTFPLPFCGHRWLENLPAVERALEVWPSIVKYVDLVRAKKVKNPGTSSFDSVCEAQMDSLLLAKFHFFMAISRVFQPFLTKYQTDVPMMLFLWEDLETLMRNLLKRFIKREALPQTPYKLVRLDVVDHAMWLSPKEVDIGMGATVVIKVMSYPSSLRMSCTVRPKNWSSSPSVLLKDAELMCFCIRSCLSPILISGHSAKNCCSYPMAKLKLSVGFQQIKRLKSATFRRRE